jgi:hypothetical protein
LRPVVARRCEGHCDLDASLDDPHSSAAGRCRPPLLPRAVSAGGRAPLRNRPAAPRREWPAAPGAVSDGGSSSLGAAPTGLTRVRGLCLARCPLSLLTALSRTLTSRSVFRGALAAHADRLLTSLQLLVTTSRGAGGARGVCFLILKLLQ